METVVAPHVEATAHFDWRTEPLGHSHRLGIVHFKTLKQPAFICSETVRELQYLLDEWTKSGTIRCVLIVSDQNSRLTYGRDFSMHRLRVKAEFQLYGNNWTSEQCASACHLAQEYALAKTLRHSPFPILLLANGHVTGSALGLFMGCSHKVASLDAGTAFDQLSQGLIPDLGASKFLSELPGSTGIFLSLSGMPIQASDAVFLGFFDRTVPASELQKITLYVHEEIWTDESFKNALTMSRMLRNIQYNHNSKKPGPLQTHFDVLRAANNLGDPAHLLHQLRPLTDVDKSFKKAIRDIDTVSSPLICLTLSLHRLLKNCDLEQAYEIEFSTLINCLRVGDLWYSSPRRLSVWEVFNLLDDSKLAGNTLHDFSTA